MALKQTMEMMELLDSAHVTGEEVAAFLRDRGAKFLKVETVRTPQQEGTDFVKVTIPGREGKTAGGQRPTLGVIGRLGGIGARPWKIGMVSDGDGAVAAFSTALKLLDMLRHGDILSGDVMIASHVCPNAPMIPHEPVDFMGSPVDMKTMNQQEISKEMDAILSVDTTKGNRVFNQKGVAISPTVKEGLILPFAEDLINILQICSGRPAQTFTVTMQDITPYGNGLYHINSILQPSVATSVPVVGVAITTESVVPGSATGASHEIDIATAVKFCIETAKAYGDEKCRFYDVEEYEKFTQLYGSMKRLQTLGSV